jgi:hypothetical protein
MNIATLDRPVDSDHMLTFKGIGNDEVVFKMPNIYEIPVYTLKGNVAQLKTKAEILEALKNHLRESVREYNVKLRAQNAKASAYYQSNKNAFDFLQKAESNA